MARKRACTNKIVQALNLSGLFQCPLKQACFFLHYLQKTQPYFFLYPLNRLVLYNNNYTPNYFQLLLALYTHNITLKLYLILNITEFVLCIYLLTSKLFFKNEWQKMQLYPVYSNFKLSLVDYRFSKNHTRRNYQPFTGKSLLKYPGGIYYE